MKRIVNFMMKTKRVLDSFLMTTPSILTYLLLLLVLNASSLEYFLSFCGYGRHLIAFGTMMFCWSFGGDIRKIESIIKSLRNESKDLPFFVRYHLIYFFTTIFSVLTIFAGLIIISTKCPI